VSSLPCNGHHLPNMHSILCSDFAIKRIDEPFVLPTDDKNEWAL
jgi:hypothetical protein